MTIKEKLMSAWETAKKMVEESNNVKGSTYPDNKDSYQDYRGADQKK